MEIKKQNHLLKMNVIKYTLTFLTALVLAPLAAVTSLAGAVAGGQDFQLPGRVHLTDLLGTRIAVNESNRLAKLDIGRLLEGYRQRPVRQSWEGEHVGKWLHAATPPRSPGSTRTIRHCVRSWTKTSPSLASASWKMVAFALIASTENHGLAERSGMTKRPLPVKADLLLPVPEAGAAHGLRIVGSTTAKKAAQTDTVALFAVPLRQGQTMLRGTFPDDHGK